MDGYVADDDEKSRGSSIERVSTDVSMADPDRQSRTEEAGDATLNSQLSVPDISSLPTTQVTLWEDRKSREGIPQEGNYITHVSRTIGYALPSIPPPESSAYHDINSSAGNWTTDIPENVDENTTLLPCYSDDKTLVPVPDMSFKAVASTGSYANGGFHGDIEDSKAGRSLLSKRVSSMPSLLVAEDALSPPQRSMISSSIHVTYPAPHQLVTAPKELGLLDDLMNLSQPWNQRTRPQASESIDIYPHQIEDSEKAQNGYDNAQPYQEEETLMSLVEKGYISDTTELNRDDPDLYVVEGDLYEGVSDPAIAAHHHSYEESPVHEMALSAPEDHGMPSDLQGDPETSRKKRRKHSRKGKERRRRRRLGEDEDGEIAWREDGTRPSASSRVYSPGNGQGRPQSRGSSRGSRTHEFLRPNSIPGVFSDDEYLVSSVAYRSGRRSAPVFSRRGFSGSDVFWKSGQTSIQRTHIQDVVYAQAHGGARTPSLLSKISGRKDSVTGSPQTAPQERRGRTQSVGASNFFGSAAKKFGKIKEEPARENLVSRLKGGAKTYGSTANTFSDNEEVNFKPDQRGYHSEYEDRKRSYDFTRDIQHHTTNEAGARASPSERIDVEEDIDVTANHLQREAAIQSSRGVFRTPQSMARKDLHVKIKETPTEIKSFSVNQATAKSMKPSHATVATIDEGKPSDEGSSSDDDDDDEDDEDDEESSSVADSDKLELKDTKTEVYTRRWYLLFLFSVCNFLWNAIWSTWGPIAQSAKAVYGWDDGDIAMFTWLGNIPFFFVMFPIAYLMDVKGMRVAMILCCGLMFAGAGMRCIPSDISTAQWLINGGQLLNGIAGTVPCSGPALLSGLWFPPNQRATATAISTIAGYLGACFSFVAGPLLVPEPILSPINNTFSIDESGGFLAFGNVSTNTTNYNAQKQGIMNALYIECGIAGILFLLVLVYFPSKPPLPPSISASIPREKYVSGIKMLVRNKQFWITAIAYGLPIGVYEVWQVVLDVNLDPMVSQQTAGWLDFYATIGGCVSGLLVSRFADFFTRQMKLFLLVFYFFAAVSILWFTLLVVGILPFDTVSIYAAIIIGGVFLDGGAPLFFELVIEVAYPVGEGVTSGLLQLICAGAGIIFLSLVQIESIGKQWMNWCYFGVVTLAIPLLFFINTSYGRADIDDMEIEVDSEDEEGATSVEEPEPDEKTALLKDNQC